MRGLGRETEQVVEDGERPFADGELLYCKFVAALQPQQLKLVAVKRYEREIFVQEKATVLHE